MSPSRPATPLGGHGQQYPLEAYGTLFRYAQRQLLQSVTDAELLARHGTLVRDLYQDRLSLDALIQQTWERVTHMYASTPPRTTKHLSDMIATAPVYLRDVHPLLRESEIAITYLNWQGHQHPALTEIIHQAHRTATDIAYAHLSRAQVTEYQLDDFFNSIYDGLGMLSLFWDDLDEYAAHVHKRQARYDENGNTDMHLWLWHAHVLSTALWALAIDATPLDQIIADLLENEVPPDLSLLA